MRINQITKDSEILSHIVEGFETPTPQELRKHLSQPPRGWSQQQCIDYFVNSTNPRIAHLNPEQRAAMAVNAYNRGWYPGKPRTEKRYAESQTATQVEPTVKQRKLDLRQPKASRRMTIIRDLRSLMQRAWDSRKPRLNKANFLNYANKKFPDINQVINPSEIQDLWDRERKRLADTNKPSTTTNPVNKDPEMGLGPTRPRTSYYSKKRDPKQLSFPSMTDPSDFYENHEKKLGEGQYDPKPNPDYKGTPLNLKGEAGKKIMSNRSQQRKLYTQWTRQLYNDLKDFLQTNKDSFRDYSTWQQYAKDLYGQNSVNGQEVFPVEVNLHSIWNEVYHPVKFPTGPGSAEYWEPPGRYSGT